jgi:hypothetical protein
VFFTIGREIRAPPLHTFLAMSSRISNIDEVDMRLRVEEVETQ